MTQPVRMFECHAGTKSLPAAAGLVLLRLTFIFADAAISNTPAGGDTRNAGAHRAARPYSSASLYAGGMSIVAVNVETWAT